MAGAIFKDRDCERTRLFAFRKRIGYSNAQGQTFNNIPMLTRAYTMDGGLEEAKELSNSANTL